MLTQPSIQLLELGTQPIHLALEHGRLLRRPIGAPAQTEPLGAFGGRDPFDLQSLTQGVPVSLIEQLGLAAFQMILGCAHQIRGASLLIPRSKTQTRFACPYFRSIISTISSSVVAVAGEDFVGDGEPFRRDDEPNADLLPVGPAVARVAPGRQRVVLG